MQPIDFIQLYNQVKHLPNVVGVSYGKKQVGGEYTTTTSVIVHVTQKVDTLSEDEKVPSTLDDIETDVVVASDIVDALTISQDAIYSASQGTYVDNFGCFDVDNNPISCGNGCLSGMAQRQIHLHNQLGSPNHQGRIIMGGLSAVGNSNNEAMNGMCTLSLVCKDNADNTPVILGNAHCVRIITGQPNYATKSLMPAINGSSWTHHVAIQNTRIDKTDLVSTYHNIDYVTPTNLLTPAGTACPGQVGFNDITGRKVVGKFKATVFIPRNIAENPASDASPMLVSITPPPGDLSGISGSYYINCWNGMILDSIGSACSGGLTCAERDYINSTPGFIITHNGSSYDKVPACGNTDAAIWSLYSSGTATIALPGIIDLGDGPFDWLTREEFFDLLDLEDPLIVYKSGARRGTLTQNQEVAAVSFEPFNRANVGWVYPIKDTIRCVYVGASANNVLTQGGDSGSPVLVYHDNQLKVLGLLSWGAPGYFLVSPIWDIAAALNISPWLSNTNLAVVESEDANITIANRPFNKTIISPQAKTHNKD